MTEGTCPVAHSSHGGTTNRDWWPNQLDVAALQPSPAAASPLGADFDYAAELQTLDFDGLKADLIALLTDSQEWWPADYGNYGPMFVRMSWHSAGTYRIFDGRGGADGGQQRFAPLNSWPDNVLLDKARRLLWPIKKKYGRKISWADLLVLAGNVAQESMGLPVVGFAFGREDDWLPEQMNWGSETTWLGDDIRYTGGRDLDDPLAAVQMGLIYVNPEGPGANADPVSAAHDIRETFARMAMNDEETVALIAGGHTFGKTHGAGPATNVGAEPESAPIHAMGLGWTSAFGSGLGGDAIGSGLEGTWTPTPTKWDNSFFDILFGYEWELSESPAGAKQWIPTDPAAQTIVADAHDPEKSHPPVMLTTDLSLRFDPEYEKISRRFHENPEEFTRAYARAWFKLIHRDMGPRTRYLGPWVPDEIEIWQDVVPAVDGEALGAADVETLKARVRDAGLATADLIATAWASAGTFRGTDKRGGANGARVRLAPQNAWEANEPQRIAPVIAALEAIAAEFNAAGGATVSVADLIVLAGSVAVEDAAKAAGVDVMVPFTPGRTDATAEQTDADSFDVLEPRTDGFRNYLGRAVVPAERSLVERATLLTLTAPETAALVGGLRVIGANHGGSAHGVFTDRVGALTNDFFVNLLDNDTVWVPTDQEETLFEGRDRATGRQKWTATRNDLVFGSHSVLRAVAEAYASDDALVPFVGDFVSAWVKVMDLDRFDVG